MNGSPPKMSKGEQRWNPMMKGPSDLDQHSTTGYFDSPRLSSIHLCSWSSKKKFFYDELFFSDLISYRV